MSTMGLRADETKQEAAVLNGDFDVYQSAHLTAFEEYLKNVLLPMPAVDPLIPSMSYSLLSGGKRLRPMLCIFVADMFGTEREIALPVAAAIEMIHAYSLIHDDLPCMDNDDLRRGRPTNHKVYGEAMALLAGDGLLTHAFWMLASTRTSPERIVEMLRSLSFAAGPYGMVGGQVSDMDHRERTATRLTFIHAHKTGKLIRAAIDLGAILGGADASKREQLGLFGEHIGQAFQMMDDWLDVTSTTEELGKTAGHDSDGNKLTYPSLFGADKTRELAETEYQAAVAALAPFGDKANRLGELAKRMVRRSK